MKRKGYSEQLFVHIFNYRNFNALREIYYCCLNKFNQKVRKLEFSSFSQNEGNRVEKQHFAHIFNYKNFNAFSEIYYRCLNKFKQKVRKLKFSSFAQNEGNQSSCITLKILSCYAFSQQRKQIEYKKQLI